MDDRPNPARAWLIKAEHDLASAKVLGEWSRPILDTAIYHCQQAGEKALKAILAHNRKPLQKTHDLEELLNLIVAELPGLADLRNDAQSLTPYSTLYRYPEHQSEPTVEGFNEAFRAAQRIMSAAQEVIG